ncbi:MAG: sterol carrier protein domain-containing protein [bacterium]
MGDDLWVRLLDVSRALAARTYGAAGELVLDVSDAFPAPSSTRFGLRVGHLESEDTECAVTSERPDLALRARDLGAAYLGGVSFATLAGAGLLQELREGAVELADAMFLSSAAPYCATMF